VLCDVKEKAGYIHPAFFSCARISRFAVARCENLVFNFISRLLATNVYYLIIF
jgi:hypothetical protein